MSRKALWPRLGVALALGAVTAVLSGGVSEAHDAHTLRALQAASPSGRITIVTSLKPSLRGSFTMRGASADSGTASARRTVAANRVQLREKLVGTRGTITVRVTQACSATTSTWKVLSGTRAYQGAAGGGRGKGRIACGSNAASIRTVLTGSVSFPPPPPPPPAQPGRYGGTTSPSDVVTFDVLTDGHTLTNWRVRQVIARCGPDEPPTVKFLAGSIGGMHPIAADGTFLISESGYSVAGKFTDSSARGTLSYETSALDPFGTVRTCRSGPIAWTAKTPPPPPAAVEPGRYCGSTTQNKRVCFNVSDELRVANFEIEITLTCFSGNSRPTVPLRFVYRGTLAVRPDSKFSVSLSRFPLEGGGQAESLSITGTFAPPRATGGFALQSPQLPYEGTWYRCFRASTSWTVSRQA